MPDRVRERMTALGLSQGELGRRVGISQQAIAKVVNGRVNGSSYLHRIARELRTTPAYLAGEIEDPDSAAVTPPARSHLQLVSATVALPDEDALAEAFRAVLMASPRMDQDELSRELARRLPLLLRIAGLPRAKAIDLPVEQPEPVTAPAPDPAAKQRASRK